MHVQHVQRTAPLVQIVDVLRDDQHFATRPLRPFPVKPGQRVMGGVGLLGLDRLAPHVIEPQHQVRVTREGLGRRHVLDPVLLP